MQITVSTIHLNHLLHLAGYLQRRDYLQSLVTGVPHWRIRSDLLKAKVVRKQHIVSVSSPEIIYQAIVRQPLRWKSLLDSALVWRLETYDRLVSSRIGACDILIALSGCGLESLRTAKHRGIVAVLDTGSTHSLYQRAILREEWQRYDMPRTFLFSERLSQRTLAEYEEADYITVPSEFVRRTFIEQGVPASKLIKNPYGVDVERFRPGQKQDDVFRVVFSGWIGLRKGIQYLLPAFEKLGAQGCELVLAGSIDDDAQTVLTRYEGDFRYLGALPLAELPAIYANSSVMVLPSLEEGLARVIPEAMACGLPVIVTPNTGGEELVRDGVEGYVVPVRDTDAIADRLAVLRQDEALRVEMGRRARERALQFTWDAYGARAITAFEQMLDQGSIVKPTQNGED